MAAQLQKGILLCLKTSKRRVTKPSSEMRKCYCSIGFNGCTGSQVVPFDDKAQLIVLFKRWHIRGLKGLEEEKTLNFCVTMQCLILCGAYDPRGMFPFFKGFWCLLQTYRVDHFVGLNDFSLGIERVCFAIFVHMHSVIDLMCSSDSTNSNFIDVKFVWKN